MGDLLLICSPIQAQGGECVWVCVGSAEEEIRNVKGKERKKRERRECWDVREPGKLGENREK